MAGLGRGEPWRPSSGASGGLHAGDGGHRAEERHGPDGSGSQLALAPADTRRRQPLPGPAREALPCLLLARLDVVVDVPRAPTASPSSVPVTASKRQARIGPGWTRCASRSAASVRSFRAIPRGLGERPQRRVISSGPPHPPVARTGRRCRASRRRPGRCGRRGTPTRKPPAAAAGPGRCRRSRRTGPTSRSHG